MTSDVPIARWIDDLDGMSPGGESAWVRAHKNASEVLRLLCEHVERLVIGDLARASVLSEKLIRLADASGDPASRSASRRIRAQTLAYANRLEEALLLLGEASAVLGNGSASLEAARVQLATLHSLARLGRHAEGIAAGVRAREAFQLLGEPVQAARAEINIGAVERMRGEPHRAIEAFGRARGALSNEPVLRAQLESNCAEALLDIGRFDEAGRAFRASLRSFEAAGLDRAAAIVEGNLADLFARQGMLELALQHFEHARQRYGLLDAPGDAARLGVEHAEALAATGLREEAIETYTRSLDVLREHKMTWEVLRGELGLGRALVELGRWDEAEKALTRAATSAEALGNRMALARSLKVMAMARHRRGDADGARTLLLRAESLLRDLPVEHLRVRLSLAKLDGREDSTRRNEALDAVVHDARKLGVPPLLEDALRVRARCRRACGRFDEAIDDYESALEQAERTRGMLHADRFRAAFAGDRHDLYEECIGAVLDRGAATALSQAFSLVERGKGRALLDLLQDRSRATSPDGEGDTQGDRAMLSQLAAIRSELNALYSDLDAIGRSPGPTQASANLEPWTGQLVEREREIHHLERRIAASRPQLIAGASSIDMASAMAMLGPDTSLLEYFGEAGMLSVLACDGRGRSSVCRGVCSIDEVRDAMEDLHLEVARSTHSGVQSRGRDVRMHLERLRVLLLDPVEEWLFGSGSLVVVPTGVLHAVPFHAMLNEEIPLCARFRVAHVPSASVLAQLRLRSRSKVTGASLVVGVSDAMSPQSEEEARAIARVLPDCTLLLGAEATRTRVLEACRGKKLIHMATHGRFVAKNPADSGVRLADGWLTAFDAHEMCLDGAHVTLSACDTGRVLSSPADEAWGLVRGLLAGGAGSLLLSLWALNDTSASEMMSECYASCLAGLDGFHLAEALRRVVMKKASAGLNPLLWAPFVFVGAP